MHFIDSDLESPVNSAVAVEIGEVMVAWNENFGGHPAEAAFTAELP